MTNKPSFSQRMGYSPINLEIQMGYMTSELRTALWNYLFIGPFSTYDAVMPVKANSNLGKLMRDIWTDYFYYSYDRILYHWQGWENNLKKRFFSTEWHEVFNILEFIFERWEFPEQVETEYIPRINKVLERELSGYRFIGCTVTPITTEEELSEIDETLELTKPISPARQQIISSIEKLSNRENPDYRASIKESIGAVETIAILLSRKDKTSLRKALNEIEKKGEISIHPALKEAFNKLYGWTSDSDGIRHALMEDSNLGFEDAKFMLVTCSAFINYLLAKASRYGIDFDIK